ncbi:hypothetical protein ACIHCV_25500 [Streptomyces sp. NPDC051956]
MIEGNADIGMTEGSDENLRFAVTLSGYLTTDITAAPVSQYEKLRFGL